MLDYSKIDAMESQLKGTPMASATCTLQQAVDLKGELPPVDVLAIRENGETKYFAFGGCHRFQAYERISKTKPGTETMVKCRILPATKSQLQLYLGSSTDKFFK